MRSFLVLLKKDFRMMVSGRFFLAAAGSLLLYTLFIQYIVSGNGLTQLKVLVGELLFIEIAAVRFLEIGSMLLKEKQMGVVRVHAVMPFQKRLFLLSKLTAFLLSDLLFAAGLTMLNAGGLEAAGIMPAVLLQTAVLSLLMALAGFGCAMLLQDFKQFSAAYAVIVAYAAVPVFMAQDPSGVAAWINWNPFYHIYRELKNAFFGIHCAGWVYYACTGCGIGVMFLLAQAAFYKEMGKEG